MADELSIQKSPWLRLREYVSDVRVEMKRVTWPGWPEVYGTTVMVILTSLLFSFYFWVCDLAFRGAIGKVLDYFLHRR
jgi:preprotein translocase SecE subunit